jgi:hypothetical protein
MISGYATVFQIGHKFSNIVEIQLGIYWEIRNVLMKNIIIKMLFYMKIKQIFSGYDYIPCQHYRCQNFKKKYFPELR